MFTTMNRPDFAGMDAFAKVAETGIGVRTRVLDMGGHYQHALAEAALLKGEPACPCGDCWRWFKKGE